ncbi:hypothetical protein EMIT0P253_30143 [Pseudomonas sp. IT-P253]
MILQSESFGLERSLRQLLQSVLFQGPFHVFANKL